MPTKTINLKMILDRSASGDSVRRDLWSTHAEVNRAVAELERILLLCRGRAYFIRDATGEDTPIPQDVVQAEALTLARSVQAGNGKPLAGTDDEVLAALRAFYEALVPSACLDEKGNPLDGDAQAAGGFAGPMMAPESMGFLNIFDKILSPPPAWVAKREAGQATWEAESVEWLKGPESQSLQTATGAPLRWVRRQRAGEPWQEDFIADQEKKRKEVEGTPTLVKRMKHDLGLLPIMAPPITSHLIENRSQLTPWDRLALRLTVAHLLSWESWNHRAASDHASLQALLEEQKQRILPFQAAFDQLRRYETQRHEELKRIALADDVRPYRLGRRAIRAFDRIHERWAQSGGKTEVGRLAILADLQSKLSGRFGDPAFFQWLARDGREDVWHDPNVLPAIVRMNALHAMLERRKHYAVFTSAEARLHPRWVQYEAPGGSNLRHYDLNTVDGRVVLTLPVLRQEEGGLVEARHEIPLAPSGQLEQPVFEGNSDDRRLAFQSSGESFDAALGGSDILFDRRFMENREVMALADGAIGPVWLKLVLDVAVKAPEEWLDRAGRPKAPASFHHFRTALANRSKHTDALAPGLRVLSVDLGLRTFASCSVFELVEGQPDRGMCFMADADKDLWARHERSFLLQLPGESPTPADIAARREAYDELRRLRHGMGFLKDILRLSIVEDSDDRFGGLDALRSSAEDWAGPASRVQLLLADMESLAPLASATGKQWEIALQQFHRKVEHVLGEYVARWRRETRPRSSDRQDFMARRGYRGGKSSWAIEYLTKVRQTLQSWSLRGRSFSAINRMDREKRGVFGADLLDHINAIKEDRIKSGADLIIQAARGYVPMPKKGWRSRFAPCPVIIFEDLARYRFRTDRSRRENSQLMRWAHREILSEATAQAGLFGITVATAGAGFTSRYHAATGAPGVRSRELTQADLASPFRQDALADIACRMGITRDDLRAGMRIPWEGGEEFVTLGANGRPIVTHADINAAQNLQRRLWTRHKDAFRLRAIEVAGEGGELFLYPESDRVQLRGGLIAQVGGDGYARLAPAPDGEGFIPEKITKRQWAKAVSATDVLAEDATSDELAEELGDLLEEDSQRTGGQETLFCDPSGHILPAGRWFLAKEFWGQVNERIAHALALNTGASPF